MKKIFILFLITISLGANAQSISLDWVKTYGSTINDEGNMIRSDNQGNIYVFGVFSNTADFDPGPATFNLTSNGISDVFIQKLDASGNFIWAKSVGSIGLDYIYGAVTDDIGNITFCGNFGGTMDIDPGAAVLNKTMNGITDMYIIQLDSVGNFNWGHTFGDTQSDAAGSLAVDANNNIIMTGSFFGTIDFDPGPGISSVTGSPGAGIIMQFSQNGNFNWIKVFQGVASGNIPAFRDITIDNAGNLLAVGLYSDTCDFDPGPAVNYSYMPANSTGALFILKLTAQGNFIWVKQISSPNYILSNTIVSDNLGNIYIGGDFDDSVDFNPDPVIVAYEYTVSSAAYVLKLDASGTFVWVKKMGGTTGGNFHDYLFDIAIDSQGDLVMCGWVSGTEDFDPNAGVAIISSTDPDDQDCFIMKMSNAGNLIYVKAFGNTAYEFANALCIDQQGAVYVTGRFGTNFYPLIPTDFDPNAGIANRLSVGVGDCFVSKFIDCNPTSGTDVINACGPYTWINGMTYTSSNSFAKDTLANANGCDSIVTLNLTITTIDTTVTINGDSLTSNTSGATYQWINCENNVLILGATNQIYVPQLGGIYAAIITLNNCTDTSACINMKSLNVESNFKQNDFSLYPNPASTQIVVQTSAQGVFKLFNQLGQEVLQQHPIKNKTTLIQIPALSNGLYYYQFQQDNIIVTQGKIVISK